MSFLFYPFMLNSLIGSIIVGISLALIGVVVVLRNMSFFGSGLSHIAFAGVGLSLLLGINPFLPTWAIVVTVSLILGYFNRKGYNEDMMMGIMFSMSMALGIFLSSFSKNYSGPIMGYLFGDVLSITKNDIIYSSILMALTILFIIIL
jgi:zinc transport system permease protein